MVLPQIVGVPLLFNLFVVSWWRGCNYSCRLLCWSYKDLPMGSIFLEPSLGAVMKAFLKTRSPGWNFRILALLL